jgi:tetratricopeptide (TPR) repeat protein
MPTVPELNLRFPDKDHVIVRFGDAESGTLPFENPLTAKDRDEIRWYIEEYATRWSAEPDDVEAGRIMAHLPVWGKPLFNAVFTDRAAERLFNRFQDHDKKPRLLTIHAEHPAILSLPWELLHDPASGGVFLFNEHPRVSIRRSFSGATGGRSAFPIEPKERLHLLFVVSRPKDAGFLDPRADPAAVLDALEKQAPGRFTWEFLRPATLDALVDRIEDTARVPVDILHFDGHGLFDRKDGLAAGIGYLAFEKSDGSLDLISSNQLGNDLHRHNIPLVVLSACQTAQMTDKEEADNSEAMGSVAARLTATGIPAVLAMTYSVLVPTTQQLFGQFYEYIAKGRGTGQSLDDARRHLVRHPEKFQVRRGSKFVPFTLHDWFIPALYQSGPDLPLLKQMKRGKKPPKPAEPRTNLPPKPEAGFFGRTRDLWDIERWFTGKTRRITITGFGGQGKTALALEAGRWLTRAGMFQAAVFVDYSRVQSRDAVSVAVSTVASVLGETLIHSEAAAEALCNTPTLVILDNLEALEAEALHELLDAAVDWSRANGSRVLCTTRKPYFDHPQYGLEGTLIHRRIHLDGLAEEDALKWFAQLMNLPPEPTVPSPSRDALVALLHQVKFHPLSIRVLAQQLKTRTPTELGQRLEQLLVPRSAAGLSSDATDAPLPELVASLQLSLDRLDEAARQVLPRLGVFQGGGFEDDLLAITEIAEEVWPVLRRQLEAAALIEVESVPGVNPPFLRFHPTLAPMLWAKLGAEKQARMSEAHRTRYGALAVLLYEADHQNPHEARAIARRELPNMLYAVHRALDATDPDGVLIAYVVNKFLKDFGLRQESEALIAKAQTAVGETGSHDWYLAQSTRGDQLLGQGRVSEAAGVFWAVLERLDTGPSLERSMTMGRLGRCYRTDGRPDLAEQRQIEEISVLNDLEPTHEVQRERASCLSDLAGAFSDQGKYSEARDAYEEGLRLAEELRDLPNQGVILGQLGTLAMIERNLTEAAERFRSAQALFQQLKDPAAEAAICHQLGLVFQQGGQWDEAEDHFRESARIKEQQGMFSGPNSTATTWDALAMTCYFNDKPKASEMWCQKAIDGFRRAGDQVGLARSLNNLSGLLQNLPGRLTDARQLAEEALAIKQTLDPGAAEIWTTYAILADIAEKEAGGTSEAGHKEKLQMQAREYRRLAREAKFNFAGTRLELRKHAGMILALFLATQGEEQRKQMQEALGGLAQQGRPHFVAAIRSLLVGERSADVLCERLNWEESMIVEAILRGIEDPETLKDLIPDEEEE